MFKILLALLLASSAAGPDSSSEGQPQGASDRIANGVDRTAPAPDAEEQTGKPKKICRKVEGTGSRIDSGKVCKTAEQWKLFYND